MTTITTHADQHYLRLGYGSKRFAPTVSSTTPLVFNGKVLVVSLSRRERLGSRFVERSFLITGYHGESPKGYTQGVRNDGLARKSALGEAALISRW